MNMPIFRTKQKNLVLNLSPSQQSCHIVFCALAPGKRLSKSLRYPRQRGPSLYPTFFDTLQNPGLKRVRDVFYFSFTRKMAIKLLTSSR